MLGTVPHIALEVFYTILIVFVFFFHCAVLIGWFLLLYLPNLYFDFLLYLLHFFFFKDFTYFLERGEGREKERERNIDV